MTRLGLLLGGAVLGWCASVGCSSSSGGGAGGGADGGADSQADAMSPSDSGVDSAAMDSAADSAPDGAASCGVLVNGAAVVMEQKIAMSAPAPTGGTVVDGKYFLTAASLYVGATGTAGPTGVTFQQVSQLTGGNYILASRNGTVDTITSGTFMDTGTTTTISQTCPTMSVSPFTAYTVSGNDITIYNPTATGGTAAQVYSKQ